MNELEKSPDRLRLPAERAEADFEAKENNPEEAEKKLAARERAETVSREVKTTKQQIQNIVANMQLVVKAVAAIRARLQLSASGAVPSVARDEKTLENLRKKLSGLYGELKDLRQALIIEEEKNIREENPDWPAEAVRTAAEKATTELWTKLGVEEN